MPARISGPAPAGYLWLPDMAKALGVEPSTLHKWRYRRVGPPAVKHAGRLMYPESSIAAHFAACKAADPHSNPELSPLNREKRPHLPRAVRTA
jgi:hypothetical protein